MINQFAVIFPILPLAKGAAALESYPLQEWVE